jgi:hypothetical protein
MNIPTTHKFVVILNKKIEPGVAINAAAHMVACLIAQANESERQKMMFIDYTDADNNKHPASGLSLIVLKADNSNKIRAARELAKSKNILSVDFLQSMTGDTYIEQLNRTSEIKEVDLEYYGLCLFGNKAEVDTITHKFSMWKI